MEGKPDWHYRIPAGDELAIARRELGLDDPHNREGAL